MENTEYLYHYTSIESLALILKNRTIRLNPLDKMDDLQEQQTADVKNLGKFVFISSWTDDSVESIPMWKMYTNSTAGVRIKLRKNPFLWHDTYAKEIVAKTGMQLTPDSDHNGKIHTFLDLSELMSKGYMSPQAMNGKILEKVTYTEDESKLVPRVVSVSDEGTTLGIGMLGKYKNIHWEFQNEWRYIMTFMSMNFKVSPEAMLKLFSSSVGKMLQGNELPPFRYFDLEIDPRYFSEMEIVCSPQMTAGNRIALEAIVEKYNPSATIRDSELLNLI